MQSRSTSVSRGCRILRSSLSKLFSNYLQHAFSFIVMRLLWGSLEVLCICWHSLILCQLQNWFIKLRYIQVWLLKHIHCIKWELICKSFHATADKWSIHRIIQSQSLTSLHLRNSDSFSHRFSRSEYLTASNRSIKQINSIEISFSIYLHRIIEKQIKVLIELSVESRENMLVKKFLLFEFFSINPHFFFMLNSINNFCFLLGDFSSYLLF